MGAVQTCQFGQLILRKSLGSTNRLDPASDDNLDVLQSIRLYSGCFVDVRGVPRLSMGSVWHLRGEGYFGGFFGVKIEKNGARQRKAALEELYVSR